MPPNLPPGYGFAPTPQVLIKDYLLKKVRGQQLPTDAVTEGELYGADARLPEAEYIRDRELHMFVKIKKIKKGRKTNRRTENGFWKVTGHTKEIKDERGEHIGTMRSLVLKSTESGRERNLLVDEYSLDGSLKNVGNPEGWVLCKIKQSKIPPRSGKSIAEEGKLVIYGADCFDMDEFWETIQDTPESPSGGPSHMWLDQSRPTPTEPPTLGGNDDLSWVDGLMDLENYRESHT